MKNLLTITCLAILVSIPIFGHIEELPIQRWDESRLAANAFEMKTNNNWLVTTFVDKPDMWNTKPPLMIWLQASTMLLIGDTTLAVRLPAALCALATCMFICWFFVYRIQNRFIGIFAPLILVASTIYISPHITRTGDYDSLLILCTTVFVLMLYSWIRDKKPAHLLVACIALTLACFTKGIAGMLFLPGVFLFLLADRQLLPLLKTKHFYIGIAIWLVIVPGYYFLREVYNPGYLQAVYENELGGRYLSTLENHKEKWWFYFGKIYKTSKFYMILALIALPLTMRQSGSEYRKLSTYLIVSSLSFLVVISTAQTKLEWYSAPALPLLAILAAISFQQTSNVVIRKTKPTAKYQLIIPTIFLLAIGYDYGMLIHKGTRADVDVANPEYTLGWYLHNFTNGNSKLSNVVVTYAEFQQEVLWYSYSNKDIHLKTVYTMEQGYNVIVYKDKALPEMQKYYKCTPVDVHYGINVYRIN